MLKNILTVFVVFLSLTACSVLETSEATHMLSGQAYAVISPENVSIYIQKPDFEYVVIGIVEARGMGFSNEARDQELAIQALKREAASI